MTPGVAVVLFRAVEQDELQDALRFEAPPVFAEPDGLVAAALFRAVPWDASRGVLRGAEPQGALRDGLQAELRAGSVVLRDVPRVWLQVVLRGVLPAWQPGSLRGGLAPNEPLVLGGLVPGGPQGQGGQLCAHTQAAGLGVHC